MTETPSRDARPAASPGETIAAPAGSRAKDLLSRPTRLAASALSCGQSNDAKRGASPQDPREECDVQERGIEERERRSPRGASRTEAEIIGAVVEPANNSMPPQESLVVAVSENQNSTLQNGNPLAVMDAANDELLMRIVLARGSFQRSGQRRTAAWDDVARAFVAAGGVGMQDRQKVTKRIGILTLVLLERPHLLTLELRGMVLEFHERNCKAGYAHRLRSAFLGTLRAHARTSVTVSSTDRGITHDKRLQKMAVDDEHLMRLVMKFRPFEGNEHKKPAWMKIVDVFQATASNVSWHVTTDRGVVRRVGYATTALLNPRHRYHAYLSPTLRAMLIEFNILNLTLTISLKRVRAENEELLMQTVLANRPFDATGDTLEVTSVVVDRAWRTVDAVAMSTNQATESNMRIDRPCEIETSRGNRGRSGDQADASTVPASSTVPDASLTEGSVEQPPDPECATSRPSLRDPYDADDFHSRPSPSAAAKERESLPTDADSDPEYTYEPECGPADESSPEPTPLDTAQLLFPSWDESLMHLVLEVVPWTQPISLKWIALGAVARAWGQQTGPDPPFKFACGTSVMVRIRFLTTVYRDAMHREHAKLTPALKRLLLEYDKLEASQDDNFERETQKDSSSTAALCAGHVSSSRQVAGPSPKIPKRSRCVNLSGARENASNRAGDCDHEPRAKRHCVARLEPDQEGDVDASIAETRSKEQRHLEPASQVNSQSSPHATNAAGLWPRSPAAIVVEPQPCYQNQVDLHHENHSVEATVATLCESLTGLNEKMEAHHASLSMLTKTVETQHTKTTQLIEAFELERREFRALLEGERDAHRRQSQALLDAIDRERRDRRDEFMTMANLIARCVPPPIQNVLLHEMDLDHDESHE